jgi:hypothetical protein
VGSLCTRIIVLFCFGTNSPLQMATIPATTDFCETAEGDRDGASIRSDPVFRPRDQSYRPSAFASSDPIQSAADSDRGRATGESRSPPILRQHFHFFGEFVVSLTFTHIRTF